MTFHRTHHGSWAAAGTGMLQLMLLDVGGSLWHWGCRNAACEEELLLGDALAAGYNSHRFLKVQDSMAKVPCAPGRALSHSSLLHDLLSVSISRSISPGRNSHQTLFFLQFWLRFSLDNSSWKAKRIFFFFFPAAADLVFKLSISVTAKPALLPRASHPDPAWTTFPKPPETS